MTDSDPDPAARLADGFWTSFRPEADSPLDVIAATTEIVLAQALSLLCPACRKDAVRDLRKRLPSILAEADRLAAEPIQDEHVQ